VAHLRIYSPTHSLLIFTKAMTEELAMQPSRTGTTPTWLLQKRILKLVLT